MNKSQFFLKLPFEIGDIIAPEGYINKYKILDILVIHYAKTKSVEVVLSLKDILFDTHINFRLDDFNWKLISECVKEGV